ncbi:phage baseplate protein [Epilithonimonas xixisoli]|nr:hypothetical protein [Epilithonimonas xixisoli]
MSTQILDALQEAYKNFNVHGAMAGDLAIILGCEVGGGGNVTDGFVHINGELLPFVGGQISTNVAIVETSDLRGFEDGSQKPVIYTRYATFGEATISYPWVNFRRPLNLFQLEDRLIKVEKATPIGLVAIWDRPGDEIPEGWVEHTDMRGNVPVGHNSGDTNFGSLGNTVGVKQVTLDLSQIPDHYHDQGSEALYNDYGGGSLVGKRTYPPDANGQNSYRGARTGSKGGGQPHSNIQPSRIVKYIRFIGFD